MDKKTKCISIITIILLFFVYGCSEKTNINWDKPIEQSGVWLKIIDQAEYDNSWQEASPLFKSAVPEETWTDSLNKIRKPLGTPVSRTIEKKKFTTKLPGFPEGEYVVLQYRTDFNKNKPVIETVTMCLENDGKWYALGYFIK